MTDQPSAPPPRDALIVAHGAPADPAPQEEVLQALAAATAPHLPAGWRVRGATLAADGALEAALHGLTDPLIYPFFMAEGFITGTLLPRRLTEAGAT
ncbi:MAG: cobalamin biosynthesis protein CbiX, partial [Paracoccaceae bacterium]